VHIPFVPQKDIVTAGKQVLGHVREFLPIMARAAHSSLSDLPTHNITVTDDDFEDEALLGIAVGEDFQILVNFGPAPRNSCLPADSIPAAVGVQKVVCTYFSLSGGSYWEPPDMVEYDFFEGTNLGEALEAIVLFERREATKGLEMVFEPKYLYRRAKDEVPAGDYIVPIGKANVLKEGSDVTLITYGSMVSLSQNAAQKLEKEEDLSIELIDLRTIKPLDKKTIFDSVRKTNRIVLVSEEIGRASCRERV